MATFAPHRLLEEFFRISLSLSIILLVENPRFTSALLFAKEQVILTSFWREIGSSPLFLHEVLLSKLKKITSIRRCVQFSSELNNPSKSGFACFASEKRTTAPSLFMTLWIIWINWEFSFLLWTEKREMQAFCSSIASATRNIRHLQRWLLSFHAWILIELVS